jgi:hypothetical protein
MFWYLYMVHNVRAYIGDLVSGGRVRYGITKPFENVSTNETAYIRVRNAHTTSLYTVEYIWLHHAEYSTLALSTVEC